MPGPNTPFEPLWIDAPDAQQQLAQRRADGTVDDELARRLDHLIEKGYVVIPGAISAELADALVDEINNVAANPEYYIARRARQAYAHPSRDIYDDPTFRLIDYHVNSRLARETIFCEPVREVLRAAFEDAINAFQCLTFNYGSQQAMHQDGAYVVVSKPLQFMASWIALEDVSPGSGELQYHVGSHKLDDFLFPGDSKSWNPARHGKEVHQRFIQVLDDLKGSETMPLETFLPKKGDALIWASDLVHGGSKIEGDRTRRSIVTHYCPLSVKPNFINFSGHYHEAKHADECYYTSRHYDLGGGRWQRLLGPLAPSPRFRKPAFMGGEKA
jgi:ectoine hydroxylase-related dioxygenase (phytanoyl-CoA dioxygenase family)